MSLSERLDANRHRRAASQAYVPAEIELAENLDATGATSPSNAAGETREPQLVVELKPATPLDELKAAAVEQLYDRMGSRLTDPSLSEEQLLTFARQELAIIIGERAGSLGERERRDLIDDVADDALGLGPLQRLLDDPTVSEVMVNGPDHIYVERQGRLQRTAVSFRSEERLRRVIERIVSRVGRRIDESSPLVDARLPDGSRVNAIIPPLAVNGSALTIRKFAADPFQTRDLVELGTISPELGEVLYACVQARLNIVVSGGTGTGKTTLLNVLSSFIPADDRVVTIEDAVELQLQQEHVVRLESRPPNIEGRGEVTIRDLVRNALRMRPDRIVVGECRGGEALDMLQAMNTGHDGSLSTVHANSPRDAIARLETLTLMAGMDLPLRAVREQIASAVDLIIHISRLRDGTRRVTQVTEVIGMEGDTVTLQDAFAFDFSKGVDDSGTFLGTVKATGLRPRFAERFEELGISIDHRVFTDAREA
jgi:pilus assembly protein CpaF